MIKNNWNEQKSLNSYVQFFFKKKCMKMHENMWLSWKRKAIKDLPMLEDKNLGEFAEENDKNPYIGSVKERKWEKFWKSFWNSEEHERRTFL